MVAPYHCLYYVRRSAKHCRETMRSMAIKSCSLQTERLGSRSEGLCNSEPDRDIV
jgi:hypothetical protein